MAQKNTSPQEHFRVPIRFRRTDATGGAEPTAWAGEFEGIAAVFGSLVETTPPTKIQPGAFVKTLVERGSKVRILWQHDTAEPIGRPVRLEEIEEGLFVRARLSDTQRGREAIRLIQDQVVTELSIGFDPLQAVLVEEDGQTVRHLKELKLYEVSLVSFAADPQARITSVTPGDLDLEDYEARAAARLRDPSRDADRRQVLADVRSKLAEMERIAGAADRKQAAEIRRQLRELDLLAVTYRIEAE
jgi:HK97 family phage prohead protease